MPRLAALALLFATLSTVASAQQPNILWIYTDDQSDDAGFFGTPAVSTPRMDALAAEGVVYRNAYTTSP
ncbi:MAG: sulfatase-like hydrolase/transferase, partial [Planctomycetota bacterium]